MPVGIIINTKEDFFHVRLNIVYKSFYEFAFMFVGFPCIFLAFPITVMDKFAFSTFFQFGRFISLNTKVTNRTSSFRFDNVSKWFLFKDNVSWFVRYHFDFALA